MLKLRPCLWDQGLGNKGKFLPLNQGFNSWFGVLTQHSESCCSLLQKPHEAFVNEALSIILYAVFWCVFVVVSLWCLCFLKAKFISLLIILGVVLYLTNNKTTFIMVRSCVLYKDHSVIAQPYNIENITHHLAFYRRGLGLYKNGSTTLFFSWLIILHCQSHFLLPFL